MLFLVNWESIILYQITHYHHLHLILSNFQYHLSQHLDSHFAKIVYNHWIFRFDFNVYNKCHHYLLNLFIFQVISDLMSVLNWKCRFSWPKDFVYEYFYHSIKLSQWFSLLDSNIYNLCMTIPFHSLSLVFIYLPLICLKLTFHSFANHKWK